MLRKLGLVTGLAMIVAGPVLAGPASARPATKTPPTTIVLTNASNGTTVVAAKGDLILVELSGGGTLRWTEASVVPPSSTAKAVLVKVSGKTEPNGNSETVFRVKNYGSAELEATGSPICSTVCPPYLVLWQAGVSVPVQDPPGPGA